MMSVARGISLAAIVGTAVAMAGCAVEPSGHVSADLSTPRTAAVSFFRAVGADDLRTARDASVGAASDRQWIDVMAGLVKGLRSYDQAIRNHFGVEAASADAQIKQALLELVDDQIQHLEEGLVKESEQIAEVDPAWNGARLSARPPVFLRRQKDLWKVDLTTTAKYDPRFSPEAIQRYRKYGQALQKAARDINSGRYRTLAEAQRESDAKAP